MKYDGKSACRCADCKLHGVAQERAVKTQRFSQPRKTQYLSVFILYIDLPCGSISRTISRLLFQYSGEIKLCVFKFVSNQMSITLSISASSNLLIISAIPHQIQLIYAVQFLFSSVRIAPFSVFRSPQLPRVLPPRVLSPHLRPAFCSFLAKRKASHPPIPRPLDKHLRLLL